MAIPIGFRFDPTDEELVRGFLFPKVTGAPLPCDVIADRDVYGPDAEPWVVFSDADDDSSPHWTTKREGGAVKKTIYVFTRVSKASNKSSARHSRIAGCGTWSGRSGPKDILHSDAGVVIGCRRMLSFECSKKEEFGHWIMHEYCLAGEGLTAAGVDSTDVVLCKITKCAKRESGDSRCLVPVPIPVSAAVEQFECLAVEGSMKKRGGRELLEEEGCFKKQKPSSFDNNGDEELNLEGCGIDLTEDFDFDYDYGNIDILVQSLVDLGC